MRQMPAFILLASLAGQDATTSPDRQFDFWVGEWNVQNRLLGDSGYYDAGMAKARIRPILGGKAILEEWNGQPGGHENVFGISIRYYDPEKQRWVIALNWPSPQQASFSQMEGSFRHGRAEFFPAAAFAMTPPRATRFTFSDALPDTIRWDMAQPVDGGGWTTNWIMEFSRSRSASRTIRDGEPIRRPPEPADCVCKAGEARQFDALVGEWSGKSGNVSATLRVTSASRGCATMCFLTLDRETPFGRQAEQYFEAWAWNTGVKKWVARALDGREREFQILAGAFDDAGAGAFVRTDDRGKVLQQTRRVTYERTGDDTLRLRHEVSADAGKTWTTSLDIEFAAAR